MNKAEKEKTKAIEEAAKDVTDEQKEAKEEELELAYQLKLLQYKNQFGMITDEELTLQTTALKKK
jgi:hypothetical protein